MIRVSTVAHSDALEVTRMMRSDSEYIPIIVIFLVILRYGS